MFELALKVVVEYRPTDDRRVLVERPRLVQPSESQLIARVRAQIEVAVLALRMPATRLEGLTPARRCGLITMRPCYRSLNVRAS